MIVLSIDPGRTIGYVLAEVEGFRWRHLAHGTITYPNKTKNRRSEVDMDYQFFLKQVVVFTQLVEDFGRNHSLVALIEDPKGISGSWKKRSVKTDHRLGVYCGLTFAAIMQAGFEEIIRIETKGRSTARGWAYGKMNTALAFAKSFARDLGVEIDEENHVLDAFGILNHYRKTIYIPED